MTYETKLELSFMWISKTSNSQSNLTWYIMYLRVDNQLGQLGHLSIHASKSKSNCCYLVFEETALSSKIRQQLQFWFNRNKQKLSLFSLPMSNSGSEQKGNDKRHKLAICS